MNILDVLKDKSNKNDRLCKIFKQHFPVYILTLGNLKRVEKLNQTWKNILYKDGKNDGGVQRFLWQGINGRSLWGNKNKEKTWNTAEWNNLVEKDILTQFSGPNLKNLSNAEVAVSLGFLQIFKDFTDNFSNCPFALIMEDDANLTMTDSNDNAFSKQQTSDDFKTRFTYAINHNFDLLKLGSCFSYKDTDLPDDQKKDPCLDVKVVVPHFTLCNHAFLIKGSACQTILENIFPLRSTIDHQMITILEKRKMTILELSPRIVGQDLFSDTTGSTIGYDNVDQKIIQVLKIHRWQPHPLMNGVLSLKNILNRMSKHKASITMLVVALAIVATTVKVENAIMRYTTPRIVNMDEKGITLVDDVKRALAHYLPSMTKELLTPDKDLRKDRVSPTSFVYMKSANHYRVASFRSESKHLQVLYVCFAPMQFMVMQRGSLKDTIMYSTKHVLLNNRLKKVSTNISVHEYVWNQVIEPTVIGLKQIIAANKTIKKVFFIGDSHGGGCAEAAFAYMIDSPSDDYTSVNFSCVTNGALPLCAGSTSRWIEQHTCFKNMYSFINTMFYDNFLYLDPTPFLKIAASFEKQTLGPRTFLIHTNRSLISKCPVSQFRDSYLDLKAIPLTPSNISMLKKLHGLDKISTWLKMLARNKEPASEEAEDQRRLEIVGVEKFEDLASRLPQKTEEKHNL
jgi:hypothetical protein